jgi:hypothetical protein
MKRALKHSMLLHATLYFLLLMGSGYVLVRTPPSLHGVKSTTHILLSV